MSDLAILRPSIRIGEIPLEVLRELTTPGIYIDDSGRVVRFHHWDETDEFPFAVSVNMLAEGAGACPHVLLADAYSWRYPLLPAMVFAKTADQIADGSKTATRRKTCPTWCKPGALFLGWDRSHRAGKGKARGIGVRRVVNVEHVGRWQCGKCSGELYEPDRRAKAGLRFCDSCWCHVNSVDTLTPAELAREGFAGMAPGEFWQMLEAMGAVVDGKTFRIAFEKV